MAIRRRFNAAYKAKVALSAVRGHNTINELSTEFKVHPNQIRRWRDQLLSDAATLFEDGKGSNSSHNGEEEKNRLYEEIGRLKVELDWLKKKSGDLLRE